MSAERRSGRAAMGLAVARLTRWLAREAGESFEGCPPAMYDELRRHYLRQAHHILGCEADEYDVHSEAP